MKRLILVVTSMMYSSFSYLNAQPNMTCKVGFKGGLNMARFLENGVTNNFIPTYHIGVSVERGFSYRIALSFDLLYSKQGNLSYFINPGLYDRVRTKYNYLILPVSLRYKLANSPFTVSPGIQLGYLVGNQVDFLPKSGYTNNDNPLLQKMDYGLSLGLGLRLRQHLYAEARYYQSIKPSLKSLSGIDPVTHLVIVKAPPERYNQVLSLSITYYPFSK